MQPINLVYDSFKQLHLLIDPLLCLQQSQYIPASSLIRCRYCHSYTIPMIKYNKMQCVICRCLTQLPENYSNVGPKMVGNYVLTNQADNKPQRSKLRILMICQTSTANQFANGMQCLKDILHQYLNIQIGLVMFDKRIKIIQLEQDGRFIVLNEETYQLVNQKFYGFSEQVMREFGRAISLPGAGTTINPTTILPKLLPIISSTSPTIILFLADLPQSTIYHTYPSFPNIQIYCILKIPYKVSTHSQMSALNQINKYSKRVKYIIKGQKYNKIKLNDITEIVHYELYQIFWKNIVSRIRIQASRERKYAPEILNKKDRIIGSLGNWIIVKLGKNYQNNQNIQVRIKYTQILKQQKQQYNQPSQEQYQQNMQYKQESKFLTNNPPTNTNTNTKHKLLLITVTLPSQPNISLPSSLHLTRYLHLYKLLTQNLTNLQMKSLSINNQIDIQICQFLRQCSYLQRNQLQNNIENCHCIHAVWPWIGIKNKNNNKKQQAQYQRQKQYLQQDRSKIRFIYYFIGYHILSISHTSKKLNKKQQQGVLQNYAYKQQITNLNDLCQNLYSNYDRILPLYYENLIHEIDIPQHLLDSDQQNQPNDPNDCRYYQYRIR